MRNSVEQKKSTGTEKNPSEKVLLVPQTLDGICSAFVLSRIFSTHPVFLDFPDVRSVNSILRAVRESGSIPIAAGCRIMDDSFFGSDGISIEYSIEAPFENSEKAGGHRTVIQSETLAGAVGVIFAGLLTDGEKAILSSARLFYRWLSGERVSRTGLFRALFLASGAEVCGNSLFVFLRNNPDVLASIPGDMTLESISRRTGKSDAERKTGGQDTAAHRIKVKDEGVRGTIIKHLEHQWLMAVKSSKKTECAAGDDRHSPAIFRVPPKPVVKATRLCALLTLLEARKDKDRPGIFLLSKNGSGKKRPFILIPGASSADFAAGGMFPLRKYDMAEVKEFPSLWNSRVKNLVLEISQVSEKLGRKKYFEAAMEMGGIDRGI